jgi:hypothetical protein
MNPYPFMGQPERFRFYTRFFIRSSPDRVADLQRGPQSPNKDSKIRGQVLK